MKYLLDSNVVIAALKRSPPVLARLHRLEPVDCGVSAVAMHELYYGAFRGARSVRSLSMLDALQFEVLELDREDALKAGEVRAQLAAVGTPIGPYDVLIAGQALARGLKLVTHNLREFQRVPGLAVEDWE